MPEHVLAYLGPCFAVFVITYVGLVVGTIFLANWQTELAGKVNDAEAAIGVLESDYYAAIGSVNAQDPTALGFVVLRQKSFAQATASAVPVLTRAE